MKKPDRTPVCAQGTQLQGWGGGSFPWSPNLAPSEVPYFWPPECCTPRTPFCWRRAERACAKGSDLSEERFRQREHSVLGKSRKVVLVMWKN